MKAAIKLTLPQSLFTSTLLLLLLLQHHDVVQPVNSFQTPIIFPLLWLTKRPLPLRPPPFILGPLTAMVNKLDPRSSASERQLLSWTTTRQNYNNYNNINSNGAASCLVEIDTHPSTQLRGLFATRDIRAGELLVEVPYDKALLVGDSLVEVGYDLSGVESVYFSSDDDLDDENEEEGYKDDLEDVLQGLYFLNNFVAGGSFDNGNNIDVDDGIQSETESYEFYSPYVNSLPVKPTAISTNNDKDDNDYDNEEGLSPDFWSQSTIREIGIPSYTKRILRRKQLIQTIATNHNVKADDLQWATFMIRSRRFTTWNKVPDPSYSNNNNNDKKYGSGPFGTFPTLQPKVEQVQGFLLPLIDMANHNTDPNAELNISVNKWTRQFDDTSSFGLRAKRYIERGEEVTIGYGDGEGGCVEFLDKYGFFLEREDEREEEELNKEEVEWMSSVEEDEMELDRLRSGGIGGGGEKSSSKLKTIVSRLQEEYALNFPSVLSSNNDEEDDLQLIGSGIREKMGINIYAVGMYGSESLLEAVTPSDLRYRAKQFESGKTSFVLEMILQAEGTVVAEAIADSVGIRYDGPSLDIGELERVISDGIGGQANKGITLRFDCSEDGVSLSVDGTDRGMVKASGLGKAFVDVYLDTNAVSPSLIDSCIENSSMNRAEMDISDESGGGSASRRTMLSLRIYLKRLMKWTKPEVELAVDEEDDNSFEASDGALASSDTDETEEVDEVSGDDTTSEESPIAEVAVESTVTESNVIDSVEEVAEEELVDEQPIAPQAVEQDLETTYDVATPIPASTPASSVLDKSKFDTADIATRIRELEAEIEAEIIRVKSRQGASTSDSSEQQNLPEEVASPPAVVDEKAIAVESKAKSLKEKATGVTFDAKLEDGLFLVGAGVRKKAIINVYAVAMYSSPTAIASLSPLKKGKEAQSTLRSASRTFDSSTPKTSFVLEMTFKADGKTIAEAIAEGVKPRYNGAVTAVTELENLIVDGVKGKGGQATKGTIFRFDCDAEGVTVSVDGNMQGKVSSDGIGSALVDVFMDDKAVSPQLVDSCMDTWCGSGI